VSIRIVSARVLRIWFSLLLFASAIGKLLDNRGFAEALATYQFPIPDAALLPVGLLASLVELALALGISFGFRPWWMAIANLALQLNFLTVALVTNLRGLDVPNCGCFGVFLARPMTWQTVIEDGVIVLLAVTFLLVTPREETSRASPHARPATAH